MISQALKTLYNHGHEQVKRANKQAQYCYYLPCMNRDRSLFLKVKHDE